jgi:uncharacterized protein (DUF1778 family)
MAKRRPSCAAKSKSHSSGRLIVRLDEDSKAAIAKAAALRRIGISDYARTVVVSQARREVEAARSQTILLTPDEQLALWTALNRPAKLTKSQRRLGAILRGEL